MTAEYGVRKRWSSGREAFCGGFVSEAAARSFAELTGSKEWIPTTVAVVRREVGEWVEINDSNEETKP